MRTHQYRDIICDTCTCRHLSADDIFDEIRIKEPKIGRATVYRNIECMAEYYECNNSTHAHLVDDGSGMFCDFPMEQVTITGIPE